MFVTVFGASGKVGRLVVARLLEQGHHVNVFVHSSSPFKTSDQISVIKGDIHNARLVEQAVDGVDAVISTLGSWHTPTKDILSACVSAAIPKMQEQGIKRIITLTGSGAQVPGEKLSLVGKLSHRVFSLIAKDIIRDSETHLKLLHESGLDWTCVRSPVMRAGDAATYDLNQILPAAWETVTRATVAKAIVDQLSDTTHLQQAPHVHAA